MEGYELSVTDYLLKPIPFDRFVKSVLKIKGTMDEYSRREVLSEKVTKSSHEEDFMFVNADYKNLKVKFSDIKYIEGWKEYVKIHLIDEEVLTLLSFKQLLEILPDEKFIRIHKSFIVAYNAIDCVERNQVKIGEKYLNIGGSYKDDFNCWLEKLKVN